MAFTTVNILDSIEIYGEDRIENILSGFSCLKNHDIEVFIRNNAINFAKQKISMTYLVMNTMGKVAGFFTLAHKPLAVKRASVEHFSNGHKRRLAKHSKYDEESQSYELSAFLIAQFGRNYQDDIVEPISGNELMDLAIDTLCLAQHIVGGGVIFLECEDQLKLLSFYENENNRYKRYGARYSEKDDREYIRLLRFF